jgi:hydroxymethylpyrimidine/phosphomethylpyrimidine kinase
MSPNRPAVLCFSGHDPSGGAGLQADIEAIISHQCRPLSIVTALTEQDTSNVRTLIPQQSDDIIKQASLLMADIPVNAIKIGLLGHADTAYAIRKILVKHTDVPVVLDPVLAAGGGKDLSSLDLIAAINQLLPTITVLTPNSEEARKLTGLDDLQECGIKLMAKGCRYVHEKSAEVINQLFYDGRCIKTYEWRRLPHSYHGSGCTLAASITALLAHGFTVRDAIAQAQQYTWNTLASGFQPGIGQYIPNRFYWLEKH